MNANESRDRWLILLLRVVGLFTLTAFGAAVMPEKWMIEIGEELGFDPFPESPLTFYLARNLSLLYGFIGSGLLVMATDLPRYRPLIRYFAFCTMSFGVLQLIVDAQSALPISWTLSEGVSTLCGGVFVLWVETWSRSDPEEAGSDQPTSV